MELEGVGDGGGVVLEVDQVVVEFDGKAEGLVFEGGVDLVSGVGVGG